MRRAERIEVGSARAVEIDEKGPAVFPPRCRGDRGKCERFGPGINDGTWPREAKSVSYILSRPPFLFPAVQGMFYIGAHSGIVDPLLVPRCSISFASRWESLQGWRNARNWSHTAVSLLFLDCHAPPSPYVAVQESPLTSAAIK